MIGYVAALYVALRAAVDAYRERDRERVEHQYNGLAWQFATHGLLAFYANLTPGVLPEGEVNARLSDLYHVRQMGHWPRYPRKGGPCRRCGVH